MLIDYLIYFIHSQVAKNNCTVQLNMQHYVGITCQTNCSKQSCVPPNLQFLGDVEKIPPPPPQLHKQVSATAAMLETRASEDAERLRAAGCSFSRRSQALMHVPEHM
jgi:hypothetical protein